jgi:hypothetical protein
MLVLTPRRCLDGHLVERRPADVALPRQVRLDPACGMADGTNGFRLTAASLQAGRPLVLEAAGNERLRANRQRIIGWAHCAQPGKELDVVQ